jgi:hypothetical protein
VRWLLKVAYAAAFGAATAYVTYQSIARHTKGHERLLVWVAVVILATGALMQLWSVIGGALGIGKHTNPIIDGLLRNQLLTLHQRDYFPGKLMNVSLHVWQVPLWYRRLFPYRLRYRLKWLVYRSPLSPDWRRRVSIRPHLMKVGFDQFVREPATSVSFRKGHALVGYCIAENDPRRVFYADLDETSFRDLIGAGSESWKKDQSTEKWRLHYEEAVALSRKYGQAAAIVLQNLDNGEAVGCLTLSLPPRSGFALSSMGQVREALTDAKRLIEPLLV